MSCRWAHGFHNLRSKVNANMIGSLNHSAARQAHGQAFRRLETGTHHAARHIYHQDTVDGQEVILDVSIRPSEWVDSFPTIKSNPYVTASSLMQ